MRYFPALLLFFSLAAQAFDPELMEGQWAAYLQPAQDPERHLFLTVNDDRSGVLVRSTGEQTVTRTFQAEDTAVRTAYMEVQLSEDETAILWAWRQNNGLRRVNGLLFEQGSTRSVRNMLPVPLEYLRPDHPLRNDPTIKALIERYPLNEGKPEQAVP